MYFNIDYNRFVNQIYHKTQIICKKGATCKKKKDDFNFAKDLYSRKDSNLVFSRFISRGEVLCYNRAKINSFILKSLENS